MPDKTTLGISDTFREYIEALVEEVVINGEPFDAQKKWLRKHSEREGVNYETIESNLIDLFEAIKELGEHESKSTERLVYLLAKGCYLSEALVNKLIDNAAAIRTQKEVEKKAQEEREQKTREEAERKAREERDRIAKEKKQLQKKLDAERKAREEAERKAREEAERKAKEEAERRAREETERKAKEKKNELGLVFDAEWGGFVCKANSWEVKGEVIIPASINGIVVSELGYHAFCHFTDIVSVVISSSVKKIGAFAFQSCYSLKIISIPNTVTEIGAQAFQNTSLTSVIIPNSVTHLGSGAFKDCKQLNSVVLSNSMSCIESDTFRGCSNLSTLFIPDSITKIDKYAFEGCWNLEKIQIGRRTYERLKGQLLHDPYKNIYFFID